MYCIFTWEGQRESSREDRTDNCRIRIAEYGLKIRDLQFAIYKCIGEMAERFKAAVLKTVERKLRGFESLSLRHEHRIEKK